MQSIYILQYKNFKMADSELSIEEIQNMKVTDLKRKLKTLGLPITGNKNELVERLQEACLSNKGDDSLGSSQLSYDESQLNELCAEDNSALEESSLLDQDQCSSYIDSSLEDNSKILHNIENNSSSKSVIMPPKKRTITTTNAVETVEKKIVINRTNATDIDFDIEDKKTDSKPVTDSSSNNNSSDEKIKLSLKNMTAAERLAMRAKRFNMNNSGIKTITSAKSSMSINNKDSKQIILGSSAAPSMDVLKKRAERFGLAVSTIMNQIDEKERLLKRKSKFGVNLKVAPVLNVDEQAKKKKRAERFGLL